MVGKKRKLTRLQIAHEFCFYLGNSKGKGNIFPTLEMEQLAHPDMDNFHPVHFHSFHKLLIMHLSVFHDKMFCLFKRKTSISISTKKEPLKVAVASHKPKEQWQFLDTFAVGDTVDVTVRFKSRYTKGTQQGAHTLSLPALLS